MVKTAFGAASARLLGELTDDLENSLPSGPSLDNARLCAAGQVELTTSRSGGLVFVSLVR